MVCCCILVSDKIQYPFTVSGLKTIIYHQFVLEVLLITHSSNKEVKHVI